MKRKFLFAAAAIALLLAISAGILFSRFPRPYRNIVENSGFSPALVYAVMKTESGFRENAVSPAGAVGVMQLLPSTAKFVCEKFGIDYEESRLTEGAYNAALGCNYLAYLAGRFSSLETALCAYNAGEGVVSEWLKDPACSPDGVHLDRIPYRETENYLKKIQKFRKIYEILYRY